MITYFIKSGNQIKIGRTVNLRSRMKSLQTSTANRLKLLAVSDMAESEAHAKAETISYRLCGEWFKSTPELREWIKSMPDHMAMHMPEKFARTGWDYELKTKVSKHVCESLVNEARKWDMSTAALIRQILSSHVNSSSSTLQAR